MSKYNKRNWIVLFLSAVLMFVSVAQATAMTMPEARIWGRADDGWNTFDANIQYSATNSLSYAYNGGLAGYANHVSGGNTQSLGASAYATTDGITPNVNNGAIAVPYLYFQWRVVRNDGGSGGSRRSRLGPWRTPGQGCPAQRMSQGRAAKRPGRRRRLW